MPMPQPQVIDISYIFELSNRVNHLGTKLKDIENFVGYKKSSSSSSSGSGDYNPRNEPRKFTELDGYAQSLPGLPPNIGPKPSLNATGHTNVSTGTGTMADHLRNLNLSEEEQKKAAAYGYGPPDEHETVKKPNQIINHQNLMMITQEVEYPQ